MKLKGWIKIDLLNYKSCDLIMSDGKIYEVKFDGQKPLDFIHYHSSAATDFEFVKHYAKDKAPYKSNYYISYLGGSKQPVLIYLKLNFAQVFKINWQLKKYLIQDKSLKLGILKYLAISLIGFLGFLIGRYYENNIKIVETPEAGSNNEIQKSAEIKPLDKDSKKDSIGVKKKNN